MRKSAGVSAGGAIALVSAALWMMAAPAFAVTSFASKASPSSGVKNGTVVTVTATAPAAAYNKGFLCVQLVLNPSNSVNYAKTSTLKTVTAGPTGKITCKQTFQSFSGADGKGITRHCPLALADVTAGFSCGVGLADQATFGNTYGSFASFHVVGDAVKKTSTGGKTTGSGTGTKTTTGGTTSGTTGSTGSTSGGQTVTGPNSVASGTGGLADRVGTNTSLLIALAAFGALLIGASTWRLVRR
jgi:hypothetical protein